MDRLSSADMHRVIGFLPKDVVDLLRTTRVCIAGGFLRAKVAGEAPTDIDLFAESRDAAETFSKFLASGRQVEVHRTRNAYTVVSPPRMPVQFIHRWTYKDPIALLESFDFSVARAAVWFDREKAVWESAVDPRFYPDLAARRLTYCWPERNEDAGGSLLRVQKFLNRGYHISPESLGCTIARLLRGVEEKSHFWQAGEKERAAVLVALLREVDPLWIVDGLEVAPESLEIPPPPQPIMEDAQ